MSFRRTTAPVVLSVLLALIVLLLWKGQWVRDEIRLYGYEPSAAVSTLATQDGMTDKGRRLYYVNHPDILTRTNFGAYCKGDEQTIVLGCYHAPDRGIYILKITNDDRLSGVMQVTAAHEMLHAAYQRLADDDKTRVDRLLQDYYDHDLSDQRIKDTIDAYKRSEPDGLVDEMHSIFGTEVAQLPAGLEQYYAQYFTARSKVTTYAANYQAAFTSRAAAVADYDAQLKQLKGEIDANRSDLTAQATALQQQEVLVKQDRARNDSAAYNRDARRYNQMVDAYNALVQHTKALISQYNDIVAKRNAIALEQQQLSAELSGGDLNTINE